MSSVFTETDFLDSTGFHIYEVDAELISEICSFLEVHDQRNMRSVCKWWRINLSEAFLSRVVDIDCSRILQQSDNFLQDILNMHVQKNTKILVLRHLNFSFKTVKFGIIAGVIKQKQAGLIQLTLKDCGVQTEYASSAFHWMHPECIRPCMMHGLVFSTKKLVLENYTMRDSLSCALVFFYAAMPCSIPDNVRTHLSKLLPIILPRHEFDCNKPFHQLYYSFIMALNSNCPEVCPEIRNEVVLLYRTWIHCDAEAEQWLDLSRVITRLNHGVAATFEDADVSALRQLDPLIFNKLTIHALDRLYF